MNLLLDTHAVVWWLAGGEELSDEARAIIAEPDNGVWVSAASIWEMSIKSALGKLTTDADLDDAVVMNGFAPLLIGIVHAALAGRLPLHHRDPFDRMIIAQAMTENLTIVTRDARFDQYDVRRIAC